MTLAHFLYIPGMVLLGAVVGYIFGSRATAASFEDQHEKTQRRAARDARRRVRESCE